MAIYKHDLLLKATIDDKVIIETIESLSFARAFEKVIVYFPFKLINWYLKFIQIIAWYIQLK